LLLFFIQKKIVIKLNFGFLILYSMIFLYLLGLLLTKDGINPYNRNDLQSILLLLSLLLLTGNLKKESLNKISSYFVIITSIIVPILAIFSLYKYILLLQGVQIERFLIDGRAYP